MTQSVETKSRRGVILYDENPFINIDTIKTRIKRMTNKKGNMMMVVSGETGEVVANTAGFWWAHEVDTAQFVKLYINGVKAFKELTGAGTRVFELLYMEMQKNIGQDRVYLSYAALDEQTATTISRSTFARGLAELIEKGFLASAVAPGWFWLNPDYIFNGDRLTFVQEYRRASEKKAKRQVPGQMEMDIPALTEKTEGQEP